MQFPLGGGGWHTAEAAAGHARPASASSRRAAVPVAALALALAAAALAGLDAGHSQLLYPAAPAWVPPAAHAQADTTAPYVANVTSPQPDGVYGAGRLINVTVAFSEPVVYSGGSPPLLALEIGGEERRASYASGNGTSSLNFTYTVRAGDTADDLDYRGRAALSGSIADASGNPANLELPPPGLPGSLGHSRDILVDHASPVLVASRAIDDGFGGAFQFSIGIDAFPVGNRTYALVGTYFHGLHLIRVHENGDLERTDHVTDGTDRTSTGLGRFPTLLRVEGVDGGFDVNGSVHAVVTSTTDDGVQLVRVHWNGTLEGRGDVTHADGRELRDPTGITAFYLDGDPYALAASYNRNAAQLIRIHENGILEARANLTDTDDLYLGRAARADAFTMNGTVHAVVAGHADDGVQLIRIWDNGTLDARGGLNGTVDPRINTPRGVEAFYLGERPHALVTARDSDNVHLVRVHWNGTLESVSQLADGAGGLELDAPIGVSAFNSSGGGTYAVVAGRGSNSLNLIHVRGDGVLLPAGSVVNGVDNFDHIDEAQRVDTFDLGGTHFAASTSRTSTGGMQLTRLSAAAVTGVTANATAGTYGPGDPIDIAVRFDTDVLVAGPLELRLNTGGAAAYREGNETNTLVFRYVVAPGDSAVPALGYAGVHALRAGPGGAITSEATGRHASAALPPPGSNASLSGSAAIEIDTLAPRVIGVAPAVPDGAYGEGRVITVDVNFSKRVSHSGDLPELLLNVSGAPAAAAYASGSGSASLSFAYTVRTGDNAGDLDYWNTTALSGDIADALGNRAVLDLPDPGSPGSLAASGSVAIDTAAPAVLSVRSPDGDGAYTAGAAVNITVAFSENVTVTGAPRLLLETGATDRNATYISGNGTAALDFRYDVLAGDRAADLDYAGAAALSAGGGTIRDAAGNDAELALPALGDAGSLGGSGNIEIGRPAATARAAFTGPNTVRIEYSAPLGAPDPHSGPVYGAVAIRGGASADPLGASGLGTEVHTVRFGGGGVAADQDGSIALNTHLEGAAAAAPGGAVEYEFAEVSIPVAAGLTVRTLTPAILEPVVPIEADGFVRVVNVIDGGDPARPAINVTGLVPAGAAGGGQAVFPASAGGVGVVTSFAEVWFPPGVRASGVPADGLIGLRVWGDAPGRESLAGRVAAALGEGAPRDLVLQRVVSAGSDGARIAFDMPVRVLLDGQAGGTAFYAAAADGPIVPIRTECAADNTTAVHAQLGGSGECQVDSGGDKAVHTYHLTLFGTARGLTDLERTVALAPPGGTVLVPPGTYAGDVLVVDRPLSIMPADPADPPVFTGYSHIVVRPSADGPVTVSGLRFEDTTHTSGGEGLASIVVESLAGSEPGMPVAVRNNTFSNTCDSGVRAAADAGAPPIAGLDISGNRFYGIGANAAACASPAAPDRADAIVLGRHGAFTAGSGTPQLTGLTVRDNYIFGTTYTGIRMSGADVALIEGNHIENVPDDGIRVLPSSNVTVRGNTIVDANHRPHMPDRHDGADGAAIEVWAGSDDVAVTLNRIHASAGALAVCAGTCDPGADAADGTGGDPVPVARADLGSADGANDVRFGHNILAASNAAPLVANKAGGALDARANYYPGRAESVADGAGIEAAAGARVDHLPALGGGPVRIGAVVADAPASSVRSIDAAAAAGFAAGADAFNAGQAGAGGTVGIEPVAQSVRSPDAADSAEHEAALDALRTGAAGDGRMRPVLENSIARAMALYDGDAAAGLAAITAMEAEYGHYPFATARNGTIVAHGADPSLVGRADVVQGLAGGPGGLRALYDFADGTATVGMQGYPNASWKWWAYEFPDPSAGSGTGGGAPQQKRSMIALHAGPDGAEGTADDLVFGAGYYPPGAPRHLLVAAGDAAAAAASAANRTGVPGVVVSPVSTASDLAAAGDALFRLAPPAPTAAGVVANLVAGDGAARAVVTSDSASLESRSMAAALAASSSSGLPAAGVRAQIVAFNSSEDGWAGPAMARIGAAVAGGGSGDTAAVVVYTGRAGALAELAAAPAADAAVGARWYAAGGLDRAALGEPAPALARTAGLTAVSQHAAPSAPVDAALASAGVALDDSTRGPAYAAYDAAFLLGDSIAAAGQGAPASAAAGHMAGAALNRTDSALGGRLVLDVNGDLALPDRYAVSRVGPDGSWAAAAGGPLYGTGTCSVEPVRGDVGLGEVRAGSRSQAAAETVVNTGTRQIGGDGVVITAGPWRYDGSGQGPDLDAGLTKWRVQQGAAYQSAGAEGTALPGSYLWPGERLEVQYVIDLTSMPALAAGTASQVITYSAECR